MCSEESSGSGLDDESWRFFVFFSSFPSLFNFYETILALASLRVT